MFIEKNRTLTNCALSALLLLLCLAGEAQATGVRKASVGHGTLYMVQETSSVLRYGPGSLYLRDKGPYVDDVGRVPGLHNIVGVSMGSHHALALDADGCLWAWGLNKYNQLGFQKESRIEKPTKFEDLCGIADFDSSSYGSILLFGDSNTIQAWGADLREEFQGRKYRFEVKIKSVVSAGGISFAITQDGDVFAWGAPSPLKKDLFSKKQEFFEIPEKLDIACRVKQIDIGLDVIFVCDSGDGYIFGRNTAGTLGTGDTQPVNRISKHPTLEGVEKIMGGGIRIAKLSNGKYVGWGDQLLGPVEWTNSGYMVDPIEIDVPEGAVDFFSHGSAIFFIDNETKVYRLIPDEHWLFPVRYSLEDYHFQEYSSQGITRH